MTALSKLCAKSAKGVFWSNLALSVNPLLHAKIEAIELVDVSPPYLLKII
jgi:hypothetical protein